MMERGEEDRNSKRYDMISDDGGSTEKMVRGMDYRFPKEETQ